MLGPAPDGVVVDGDDFAVPVLGFTLPFAAATAGELSEIRLPGRYRWAGK